MRRFACFLLVFAALMDWGAMASTVGSFNGLQAGGASRFDQMFVFSAPEKLTISDSSGKNLAVISDARDVFVHKSLTAYCVKDTKLLVVLPNARGDYQIDVAGIPGNLLEITAYRYDREMSVEQYRVAAEAGEAHFRLYAQKKDAPRLVLLDAGGAETPLQPVDEQRDWREYLARRGLPGDEVDACAALLEEGLIDGEWLEHVDEALTVEAFGALLTGAAQQIDGGAAAEPPVPGEKGQARVGQAVALMDQWLARLGVCNPYTLWDWAISPQEAERLSNAGVCATLSYTCGVCRELNTETALTRSAAALMIQRFMEAVEVCRARDDMIRRVARAGETGLAWNDLPEQGMAWGGASDLARVSFWTPDESAYGLIYADAMEYLLPRLSELSMARGEALEQADTALATWPEMGGVCADDSGAVYRWTPVALIDGAGELYGDHVMIALCVVREGIGRNYLRRHALKWKGGDATSEYYLIANPDVVAALLERGRALALPGESLPANCAALSRGSSGEGVRRLQAALIQSGYYDGADSGAYGRGTADAVRAFQKAEGLEQTGLADSETLKRLYARVSNDAPFRRWLEAYGHDGDAAERILSGHSTSEGGLQAIID